jgi:4'-phosphopantetheinyl transferase
VPEYSLKDNMTLSDSEVCVWRMNLDAEWSVTKGTADQLSHAERERANRFNAALGRQRYVAARMALRRILGDLLGHDATTLEFGATPSGRPFLAAPSNTSVDFNISHTGPDAVIAIAVGRRVGVDIERIRPLADAEALVERFFSVEERQQYRAIPVEDRLRAFFVTWARKEAFVKATGRGIADSLHRFAVTVDPHAPPRLLRTDWPGDDVNEWRMTDLPQHDGIVGALAAEGEGWHVAVHSWDSK